MAPFVRKVKTASGATAVQIAKKQGGVRTIVEHIGSAHTEAELTVLMSIAREKIHAGQQAFDLDALTPSKPQIASPTITSSRARVLWEVLEDAYARLGFAEALDGRAGAEVFQKLVLARLIEPTSKADTIRVCGEIGVEPPALRTIWRVLARSIEENWRDTITAAAYQHAARQGPLTVCLYDVTTLYFEAEYEDEFRKVGMSKERRVDPQILVGLLVTGDGFPLEMHTFTGNTAETLTLIPVLNKFRERHHMEELVVVADAGMLSASNLNQLEDAGYRFIVGSRISKAPYDLAAHFERHGDYFKDGQTLESARVMGVGRNARERRVVYHYSWKREKRDNRTLNKQIERAEKVAAGKTPLKKDRFVSLSGKKPGVDWGLVERARSLLGLKGYVTNISTDILTGHEIVAAYHDLFQVERSFRMAKTDLRARPMFHHQRDSIEAHLTIVFAALAIARDLQEVTGVSIRKLVRALKPLRDVTVSVGGQELTAVTPPTGDAQLIIEALGTRSGH